MPRRFERVAALPEGSGGLPRQPCRLAGCGRHRKLCSAIDWFLSSSDAGEMSGLLNEKPAETSASMVSPALLLARPYCMLFQAVRCMVDALTGALSSAAGMGSS